MGALVKLLMIIGATGLYSLVTVGFGVITGSELTDDSDCGVNWMWSWIIGLAIFVISFVCICENFGLFPLVE